MRALIDAKHQMIPVGGETENGFRKLCGEHAKDGLQCTSARHRPGAGRGLDEGGGRGAAGQGDAAVDLGAARARRGSRTSRPARTTSPTLTDNFFVGNDFPPCGMNFKAPEIMGQTETNK